MNLRKELQVQVNKMYNSMMDSIPEKIRHHDIGKHIIKLWERRGIGRRGRLENLFYMPQTSFPRYIFLYLGPEDRAIDINFFIEEAEEKFGLNFLRAEITEDGASYDYGLTTCMLKVFFSVGSNGNCKVISKEVAPTILKNYERVIVCN